MKNRRIHKGNIKPYAVDVNKYFPSICVPKGRLEAARKAQEMFSCVRNLELCTVSAENITAGNLLESDEKLKAMEQIENLLKEYKIRFNVTDRIKEDGYQLKPLHLNKGDYTPSVSTGCITNINGRIYTDGVWATADVKEKPEKWVVQRNFGHPLWAEFCNWLETKSGRNITGHYRYYNHLGKSYNKLTFFPEHQYLTLEQWAEFCLLKVDFSILNNKDWFYLESNEGNEYLARGASLTNNQVTTKLGYSFYQARLFNANVILVEKSDVMVLRKATGNDLKPLFKQFPELAPKTKIDAKLLIKGGWFYVNYGEPYPAIIKDVKFDGDFLIGDGFVLSETGKVAAGLVFHKYHTSCIEEIRLASRNELKYIF